MMNKNKGQVLVAFILLLPVLFMFMGLIVDVGYLYIEKRHIDNNVKDVLEFGLTHIEQDTNIIKNKIKKQLDLNIDDIKNLDIKVENQIIEVKLEKSKKSIFSVIFSKFEYKISSDYRGYINEEEIVIRKA